MKKAVVHNIIVSNWAPAERVQRYTSLFEGLLMNARITVIVVVFASPINTLLNISSCHC